MNDRLAESINDSIINSKLYKRYVMDKSNVEKSPKLQELRKRMKELKDKNCKDRNVEMIDEYYSLEREYSSDVLVKKYEESKSEVYALFEDICDILSFK